MAKREVHLSTLKWYEVKIAKTTIEAFVPIGSQV